MVLQHQEDAEDGFGLHLSGGLPPVTVTYVKPGSQAEEVGLRLGDVILEVNGLNCRKKVDITRLMELKMLVQQSPAERHSEQEHIDVSWLEVRYTHTGKTIHRVLLNHVIILSVWAELYTHTGKSIHRVLLNHVIILIECVG